MQCEFALRENLMAASGVVLSNVWEVKTVKSTHRLAAPAAGLLALSLAAAPLMAQGGGGLGQQQPQRGGPPNNDTPYILVTTFHSDDRKLGVDLAEDLRKRVSQEHSARELFVIQKKAIDGTLEASGYRPDSALSSSDLMELAKQLRGEIVVDGTVTKSGSGLKLDTRILMKSGQATLAQPLPVTDAKDVGDASKQLEKAISESNKALASFKTCKNNMTAAKYPEAATAARAGLAAYPNSAFSRVCLLQSLVAQKAAPDQIIEAANAIKQQDPHSAIAYANLSDAYMAKGDTTHAMEALLGLYREDPSNKGLATSIVGILANSGAPDQAIPIIDSLLVNDPSDAQMLKQKWLLLLRANHLKDAMAAGEAYVKVDTAAANVDYFQRQIGTAQKDSNAAAVAQFATRASARFPTNPDFTLLLAQNQLKSGQLQQAVESARRATQAAPKDPRGWQLLLAGFAQMKQSDSIVAAGKAAVAAGVSKDDIGASLASVANEAFQKAQASKTREDYQAALDAAQTVDAIAPSPQSAFFIGVSAYSVAADILGDVQKLSRSTKKADQAQACTEAKQSEDLLALAQINMPKGASVSKEAAGQIMGAVGQYGDFISGVKKAFCK
jgi:tetratricopeptide (TPR) repeat protein